MFQEVKRLTENVRVVCIVSRLDDVSRIPDCYIPVLWISSVVGTERVGVCDGVEHLRPDGERWELVVWKYVWCCLQVAYTLTVRRWP